MFIPSKMFEIMASESCAVAALSGEGADIMRESGSAMVVGPEEPEHMAEAIATLLDDPVRCATMAKMGREYVEKNFLHSHLAATYLQIVQELVERK